MENLPNTSTEKPRSKFGSWILTALLVLGLLVGWASFASTTSAAAPAQAANPTMPPMPGMQATPTAMPMPGMTEPTAIPGNTQPQTGGGVDALIKKMQDMMLALNGMMGQLDQKSASLAVTPTATPAAPAVDMQAMTAEMQSINQAMVPLMTRIQADLQGNPSAEEIAAVRAQVEQIYGRMANLMSQLMAANTSNIPVGITPVPDAAMPGMPGMGTQPPSTGSQTDQSQAMAAKLNEMMQKMQGLMQQMQSGSTPAQQGTMPGMNMPSPTPMPGMGSMPGMSSTPDPAMSGMMSMMDDMMMMMDSMMGMGGMSMPSPTPMPGTGAMPGMPAADPAMSDMMTMMDDMMSMMDNMMMMMDGMMMPGMSGGMPDM